MSARETEQLWFFNTLVEVRVPSAQGVDGISMIDSVAPLGDSPPLHIHHTEDELFYILEGEFRFQVGSDEIRLGPGESMLAPKGIPHTYLVESKQGRWLVVTTHGDFERFVRATSGPAERPELPEPAGPPTPEQAAALAEACLEHNCEIVGPPLQLPAPTTATNSRP